MRRIIQYILKVLAQLTLWRYQPLIIGITGSVGKTSAKEAIYRVLRKDFAVRRNRGNYNNEIGVPLTILDLETAGRQPIKWLFGFLKALFNILWSRQYPEILILEMGVDQPGDMQYLMSFIPVRVGLMTAIGEFPSHIEFFPEREKLIEEKALLIKSVNKKGLVLLNYDDLSVRMVGDELGQEIKALYYGFGQGADIKISNYELYIHDLEKKDFGIVFKIEYQGNVVPIRLGRVLGRHQAYAATAAVGVGLYFGLNLVEIAASLRKYRSLPGRTKLVKGIKNSWIIDDSYNASPLASIAALEILEEFYQRQKNQKARKIVVLGDMLELGDKTELAHRQVGQKAAQIADLIFTIGTRAKFIGEAALQNGFSQDKIFDFLTADEAGLTIQERIQAGDVILIKGSRAMHLEKIVQEIAANP